MKHRPICDKVSLFFGNKHLRLRVRVATRCPVRANRLGISLPRTGQFVADGSWGSSSLIVRKEELPYSSSQGRLHLPLMRRMSSLMMAVRWKDFSA